MKGLAMPMILLATAQELRKTVDDPLTTEVIDRSIAESGCDFLKPEFHCVLETVGPEGQFIDTFDGLGVPGPLDRGQLVYPRRSPAAQRPAAPPAWHNDPRLVALGWDQQYGGVLYYRDAKGFRDRVLARHEVLVAAQRDDHRHAFGLAIDRRNAIRPLAPDGPRLGLRPFSRSPARRVVRLSAPTARCPRR